MKNKELKNIILPNENVIAEAKFNLFGRIIRDLIIGIGLIFLCILICQLPWEGKHYGRGSYDTVEPIALFVGSLAFFWMIIDIFFGTIELKFSKCILTNQRIIIKVRSNLILRLFSEIPNNRIESVTFVQSFLGRWLNYGTIVMGASKIRVRFVKNPYELHNQIVNFMYNSEQ